MATENATQGHTTVDEEEVAVVINWQSSDSNNNGSDNSGSYESFEDELGYLLQKRGPRKGSDE
jgi:heme-degrading monooxygenase HmoA